MRRTTWWALALFLLLGCGAEAQHLWREIEVRGGTVQVKYADPPIYGSHTLSFYWVAEGADAELLGIAELDNDGANLGEENLWVVEETEERLVVALSGQQMEEELWEVVFGAGELRRVE